MKYLLRIFGLLIALLLMPLSPEAEASRSDLMIHHDLKVTLSPNEHRLSVEDVLKVPKKLLPEFRFLLHKGLDPLSSTPGVTIIRETVKSGTATLESYRVKLPRGVDTFALQYGGSIYHEIESGKEQDRGVSQTPGIISEEVVYLGGSSFWYPTFDGELVTFSLDVKLPKEWDAVSQGERTFHDKKDATLVRWDSPEPQDEIFIIAARFTEYVQTVGRISAMVFLREPDRELAAKYLNATARYISMYEKLIGTYPYKKFALVENFWETGFGMPSFTLLGSKVIRLPFIVNSSYPHEILHNWWGNSVFPDSGSGNWTEGLTAYLSDHLIKEQQGGGAEYRLATLQKYADYVLTGRDFPLTQFRSRHSSPSEAVGYGKSLMFFHMLRRSLGDEIFIEGLQDFYRKNRFRFASFTDLRKSLESVSERDLKSEFDRWVAKTGAPKLRLVNVTARGEGDVYVLTGRIEQVQPGDAYPLRIPVAVTMEGKKEAHQTVIPLDKKRKDFEIRLPSRPLRLDVDPEFDLFRRLDRNEIPPAISQALGARKMLVILPASADSRLLKAYREFAAILNNSGPDVVEVRLDTEIKELPTDRAITLLGWENRFFSEATSALAGYDVTFGRKGLRIEKTETLRENHSVVLTARNPENGDMALTLIASALPDALPGLGRKLPHYHKYSYLVFEGREPSNIAKGRWPVFDSPMTAFLPGKAGPLVKVEIGGLAVRRPLITLPEVFSSERMMEVIRFLSSSELKGRGFGEEGLEKAAEVIAQRFREAGLIPAGDGEGNYFQTWEESGGDPERGVTLKNVIGVIPGKMPELSGESVVIGAHYDHLGLGWPDARGGNKGKVHPGADDNASGVAVLIDLARVLAGELNPDRTIVFAAFTGEEAGKRGSKHYVANQRRYPIEKVIGMVNMDTVGRLGKKKLLVLGAGSAKEWVHIFRGAGFVTGVEIETVSEELDSSDQKSFQEAGVPAVQLFGGPHLDYHRPTDTLEKIDSEGLVKVASVAKEVIEYLSSRKEPLDAAKKTDGKGERTSKRERKVGIGIVPDFAYKEKGCRLSGIVPGSPAEVCGLKEGDIIVRISSHAVTSLKDLSDVLKSLAPGTRISITFLRDGKEMTVEAEVTAK